MLPLIAIGGGLASAGLNYAAGRKAAKATHDELKRYQRRQAYLMKLKQTDQWETGKAGQDALGNYIGGMTQTMSAPASVAPVSGDFVPNAAEGAGAGGADWQTAYRAAMAPKAHVDDTRLAATQATMDRQTLARALESLGYTTQMPVRQRANKSMRNNFQYDQQLSDNDAQHAGLQLPNSVANMQLMASLFGVGSQAAMMGMAASTPAAAPAGGLGPMPASAWSPSPLTPWLR